jgi:hypothetical protein
MRRASGGIGVIDTAAVMLCLPSAAVAAGEQSGAMPRDIRGYLASTGK